MLGPRGCGPQREPGWTVILLPPVAAFLLAPGAAAQQQVFDYQSNGFCDTSALSLNGDATEVSCVLAVTDGRVDTTGSVWTLDNLALGPHSVIRSQFAFEIREGGAEPGSGMTFALFSGGAGALGLGGGGLGFETLSPSVAVELDTFQTVTFADISGNHVGVDVNGSLTSIVSADPGIPLSGPLWMWVEYHQRDQLLEVWISADANQPAAPLLTTSVDLLGVLGSMARVGFTAANTNSGYRDLHLISTWLVELDDDTDADGVMDFEELCLGDDATGDTDGDLVCDGDDECPLDALDDQDGDEACDSDDPCPLDPLDDDDDDGVCDSDDVCPGEDDAVDDDRDDVPDCLDGDETVDEPTTGDSATVPDRAPGSLRAEGTPTAGCGCGAGGAGPTLGGLLALAAMGRARSRAPRR
jgi:hypothetical protein